MVNVIIYCNFVLIKRTDLTSTDMEFTSVRAIKNCMRAKNGKYIYFKNAESGNNERVRNVRTKNGILQVCPLRWDEVIWLDTTWSSVYSSL